MPNGVEQGKEIRVSFGLQSIMVVLDEDGIKKTKDQCLCGDGEICYLRGGVVCVPGEKGCYPRANVSKWR